MPPDEDNLAGGRPPPPVAPPQTTAPEVLPEAGNTTLQADAVRGSLWTALQGTATIPLALVANVFIARTLAPEGYGTLAALLAAFGLLTYAANLGVNDAAVQFGAQARARGRDDEVLQIARSVMGYHLVVELPLVFVVLLVLLRDASPLLQVVGALSVSLNLVLLTATVMLNALSRTAVNARIALLSGLVSQAAILIVAVQTERADAAFVARLCAVVLFPALGFLVLPRTIRRAMLSPTLRGWSKAFWPYALRTCVAGLLAKLIISRAEIFVLQAYGETEGAGLFALAFGLSYQISAPLDAILGPMAPATAGLLAASAERARGALLRGLRLSAVCASLLVAAGVPALVVLLPLVYGDDFRGASALLIPLALVSFLQSVSHPCTAFLYAARRVGALIWVNLTALIADLLLAVALIPLLGAAGAVVANCVGQILVLTLSARLIVQTLQANYRELLVATRIYLVTSLTTAAVAVAALALADGTSVLVTAPIGSLAALVLVLATCRALGPVLQPADLAAVASGLPAGAAAVVVRLSYAAGLARRGATGQGGDG